MAEATENKHESGEIAASEGKALPSTAGLPEIDDGSAESDATLPSQKIIYDIALKKVETLDRYFDNLNLRAGAIFGFASFIVPNALQSAKEEAAIITCSMGTHEVAWPAKSISKGFASVEFLAFGLIILFCYLAYRVESDKLLPKLGILYRNDVRNPEWKTREILISHINDMCESKDKVISRKASCIRWALIFLVVEIALISAAFCLTRLCA